MITGAHTVLYSADAEADRGFLRDVLGWPSVDAGGGWMIFAAPPAEVAVHPTDGAPASELMLMCDDLAATVAELAVKGVEFTKPVQELRWGRLTALRLPGGGEIGLYEPLHPTAHTP
ncbi:VOC family protein [Streptomyces sp. VRA16 Mangrove soil]|uniref:VOC family protein n=1 Tax=Streptomyces sp. VRA16 Mangrove soil TaxID=2817434 RepID=UPI001A9D16AF|nr:VOC family protein [Streptomyces sp. VRA16 Mangrove soil]MBO1336933.1 extradiol dioxygenase [Streptomyces sp. VRA16 Mangrove soil]